MFINVLFVTMKPDKNHHILSEFSLFTAYYILIRSVDRKKLKLLSFVQLQ